MSTYNWRAGMIDAREWFLGRESDFRDAIAAGAEHLAAVEPNHDQPVFEPMQRGIEWGAYGYAPNNQAGESMLAVMVAAMPQGAMTPLAYWLLTRAAHRLTTVGWEAFCLELGWEPE